MITTAIISLILFILAGLIIYIVKKIPYNQIQQVFVCNLVLVFEACFFVLMQILFSQKLNIEPIYFDYLAYIGCCFMPVSVFFTALVFANTKIKFKKWYILLFIVPIISLLLLWTNNLHHLFYVSYSININDMVYGPWLNVHIIYSYTLLLISMAIFIKYSVKNSGFFSKQSLLFTFGTAIPFIINILGTFSIIPMTIYMTPITFGIAIILYTFAIFKFQFLSVSPIALQKIVDRISDGYIVINEDNCITDFNRTFLELFKLKENVIRNMNLFSLIEKRSLYGIDVNKVKSAIETANTQNKTVYLSCHFNSINKYFNIEISPIISKNNYLGTIILLKDITQHTIDMQTIENNQNLLMERERLASLGQLIGGIAHNLKTPIMSISGAAEGLKDLINEYDSSIEDPTVNFYDHHQIAKEMMDWTEKIKTHTAYMSDIITTVKGQAVVLSDADSSTFTIDELIKKVTILMRHELKNALIELNTEIKIPPEFAMKGNVNSLIQVINNMISNSIQAYNGTPNKTINLLIDNINNAINISISDSAGGLPAKVKDKLFKEMITTKGKNGTGLGLFMSYSTIRAHFDGDITFTSEKGKGTTFTIILPIK